jgi:hypothetical protein
MDACGLLQRCSSCVATAMITADTRSIASAAPRQRPAVPDMTAGGGTGAHLLPDVAALVVRHGVRQVGLQSGKIAANMAQV